MDYVNIKEKSYVELNRKLRGLSLSSLLRYETRIQRLQRCNFLIYGTSENHMYQIKDKQYKK
jgi:hypothetical protein